MALYMAYEWNKLGEKNIVIDFAFNALCNG